MYIEDVTIEQAHAIHIKLTKKQLKDAFLKMDVGVGKTVLVHSSYKSLGNIEGGPQTVVDALMELIGEEGTLLFPTFNFTSWTETHYFDMDHTSSEMGVLTEIARHDSRFKRTRHPIYSFVVAGYQQNDFCDIDSENCYGPGSVFAFIHEKNTLMLSLGLSFNNTFSLTHHAEKISGACDYRYDKSFSGIYVGHNQTPCLKTYAMMVRDVLKGVQTDIIPAMNKLVEEGIIFEAHIGKALCHFSYAQPFLEELVDIVKTYPEMLYKKRF